jgi:phosphate starvation-inducible protein PhoH
VGAGNIATDNPIYIKKVLDKMRDFSIIEFDRNDIVRSDLVKSYIIAREKLEDIGLITPL